MAMGECEIEGPIGEKRKGQQTERCPPLRDAGENRGTIGGDCEEGDVKEHSRGIELREKGEKEKRGIERGIEAVLAGSQSDVEGEEVEEPTGAKTNPGGTCWAFRRRGDEWRPMRSRCGDRRPFRRGRAI